MLLKFLVVARALAALANTEAFKAFISALQDAFADREPLFGAAVDGDTNLQEFKALCKSKGDLDDAECDDLCGKMKAAAEE